MKEFISRLCIVAVLAAFGFHYWELRWQLQTTVFRNDIYESEHRILRDEINELSRRPTYKQGVFDTIIRADMDTSFSDGLRHAYENLPMDTDEAVEAYHRAVGHDWAMIYYQQQLSEKKLKEEREKIISVNN